MPETLWPSGLRRWLKAPVRKGVGSNPTGVTSDFHEQARAFVTDNRATLAGAAC